MATKVQLPSRIFKDSKWNIHSKGFDQIINKNTLCWTHCIRLLQYWKTFNTSRITTLNVCNFLKDILLFLCFSIEPINNYISYWSIENENCGFGIGGPIERGYFNLALLVPSLLLFKRPGVAGAILQSPPSLINSFIDSVSVPGFSISLFK